MSETTEKTVETNGFWNATMFPAEMGVLQPRKELNAAIKAGFKASLSWVDSGKWQGYRLSILEEIEVATVWVNVRTKTVTAPVPTNGDDLAAY